MKLNLQSISTKLILGGILAVLIPLIVVGYISYSKAANSLMALSKDQVGGIASDLARLTRIAIEAEMTKAELLAEGKGVIELSEAVARFRCRSQSAND